MLKNDNKMPIFDIYKIKKYCYINPQRPELKNGGTELCLRQVVQKRY